MKEAAPTGSSTARRAPTHPHLIIAAILAAGADGVERSLAPPPMGEGDMYGNPGDSVALPTDLAGALAAYEGSALAGMLGDTFSRSYASIARPRSPWSLRTTPTPTT